MNPWIIVTVVVALCAGSMQVGRKLERTEWQAKETKTAKAVAQAKVDATHDEKVKREQLVAANEALRDEFDKQTRIQNENHQIELAAVEARRRADAHKRVPIGADFCKSGAQPTAGESKAAGSGGNGQDTTGGEFLPDAFAGDLRQLAADADEVAADLRSVVTAAKTAGCFLGYDAPPTPGDKP